MSIDTHIVNQFCSTFIFSSVFKSDQCQLTQHSQSIFQSTFCFFSVFGESRILQRATSERQKHDQTRFLEEVIFVFWFLGEVFLADGLKRLLFLWFRVPCQVLCNLKNKKVEQAFNTVWKNTAASISFSFFTLRTVWFKPMGLESDSLPSQL